MDYAIAVFDIGKTNKKLIVFTDDLKPVYEKSSRIGEIEVEGVLCDNAEAILSWITRELKEACKKYPIKSVSITTYGATVAYLKKGSLAFPIVSYNHQIDDQIREGFYKEFGSPLDLYKITGAPPYGRLINAGIQLYWFKRSYPEKFAEIDEIMFLPQYLTYEISGFRSCEVTSVGCHTYLYDLRKLDWSFIAERLNADELFPSFAEVWSSLGEFEINGLKVTATPGIHDSNASLLPFMLKGADVVLASTGTWCVFMYPAAEFDPREEDLRRDVVYYLNAYGKPVKASRFIGGYEHDHYSKIIQEKFNTDPKNMSLDTDVVNRIIKRKEDFIMPGLMEAVGQFQKSKPKILGKSFYENPVTAYHLLNLYLALQSYVAISLLLEGRSSDIIVQGGFAKNRIYLSLLSTLFQKNRVIKSAFPETTSLGAAMCGKCAYEGVSPERIALDLRGEEIEKLEVDLDDLREYLDLFVEKASAGE